MTKEQKEALERLNKSKNITILYGKTFAMSTDSLKTLQIDIETVLNMLNEKDKRIKELEEENTQLEAIKDDAIRRYNFESIPIQKVNDEIEKYEYMLAETIHGRIQKYTPGMILLKIDTLKELLEKNK